MNKLRLREVKPLSKGHTALLVTDGALRKCLKERGQKKQLVGEGQPADPPAHPLALYPTLLATPREAGPMLTSLSQSLLFLKVPHFYDIKHKDRRLSVLYPRPHN